jgi:uncharacterized protein (DUF58 family)
MMLNTPKKSIHIHKTDLELTDLLALKAFASIKKSAYSRPRVNALQSGNALSRLRGRGMEFEESRHYSAGDEIRHMDWRVTARTGKAHTKVFCEEHTQSVYFYIHFSPSLYFGTEVTFKSVLAIEIAAILGWRYWADHASIGGLWQSSDQLFHVPAKTTEKNLLSLFLRWIAQNNARQENLLSWDQLAKEFVSRLPSGSRLIILGDFYQPDQLENFLRPLASRYPISVVHLYDRLEQSLPPPQFYSIIQDNQYYSFDTSSPEVQRAYQQNFEQRRQDLRQLCSKYKAKWASFSAQDALQTFTL